MDCKRVCELVPDFIDDNLERPVREQFLDHVAECRDCKNEVKSYQCMTARLRKLPLQSPPIGAKDAIMAALRAEAGEAQTLPSLLRRLLYGWKRPTLAFASLALLVMIVCSLGLFSSSTLNQERSGRDIGVVLIAAKGALTVNGDSRGLSGSIPLQDRDMISVSPDFLGKMVWPDRTEVRIKPGSSLIVHAKSIDLRIGEVWVKVTKQKKCSRFSVRTPLAVAAVKGTKFEVVHNLVGTLVGVIEGVVGVTDLDSEESVDLTANRYAEVTTNATIKVGDFSDNLSVVNDLKPFFRVDGK